VHKLSMVLGLAIPLGFLPAPVLATGLSMNEVPLRTGATLDECRAAGRTAISQAGLQAMPDAPASVFGLTSGNELAAIYCLPQRGIAIIAVAGTDNQLTRPILARLIGLWSNR
jgi:hypothetical protein